jgi:hypothetical protein
MTDSRPSWGREFLLGNNYWSKNGNQQGKIRGFSVVPLQHSAAHIMAQAVLEKFPDGKVAIGPALMRVLL